MILKKLSVTNYKNIASAELEFSDKLNCIVGSNGMGKTNLLDSIYYLSFTKPFVYLPDSKIIRRGDEIAILDGRYRLHDKEESLYCGIQMGKPKVLRRNKKEYAKISEHIGRFPLVMISPSDIELLRGHSDERRRFMDMIISQESAPYLTALMNYRRLLEQRNKLLKESRIDPTLLSVINKRMAPEAVMIVSYRQKWIKRIYPHFLHYYSTISNNADPVDLEYQSSFDLSGGVLTESFEAQWEKTFAQDKALGHTTIGPHKDDLLMLLEGELVRKCGSQGQNKTYLIALKFAQFSLLKEVYEHITPLLLLDDVFDKLDEERVACIVRLVSGDHFGQIFMTDTNRKYLDQILSNLSDGSYSIFQVKQGVFFELPKGQS